MPTAKRKDSARMRPSVMRFLNAGLLKINYLIGNDVRI